MKEILELLIYEAARAVGRMGIGVQVQFGVNPECPVCDRGGDPLDDEVIDAAGPEGRDS